MNHRVLKSVNNKRIESEAKKGQRGEQEVDKTKGKTRVKIFQQSANKNVCYIAGGMLKWTRMNIVIARA
jgi:hypothetical protein